MKFYKQLIFILIFFSQTETLLSENDFFNVNNIQLVKKDKSTNNMLANQAIKNGFQELITRILLEQDIKKLSDLNFSSIKQLVTYYQISNIKDEKNEKELVNFSITFDKDKIHGLFYEKGISYSKISDKELYILPILIKKNEIFVYNNNFFYENWNKIYDNELVDFILPLENIEVIQKINLNKASLINLELESLFQEYSKKNKALIFIDDNKSNNEKIYIKTIIQGKKISKSISLKKRRLDTDKRYEEIIIELKKELINLVKSENLIDIRTPSFLNVKLELNKNSNLVELNLRIKNIDLIENVYVQEFNKDYMNLRIKYLGKLDKMINQLKNEMINLQLIENQWIIKTL